MLHNCTNDYMWLSYTVLWGEKWCQLTHTTTEQWWVIPYKVMMLWTKRERKNAHTRLVTNDESSQLNTSHDEGNKVLEKEKQQPQCHHKRWQLWCHRFSETKVKALLNHTQSTNKSRGLASHQQGMKSVGNGRSTRADLRHTSTHDNTKCCYKSPASNPGPGWVPLVD